MNIPKFYPNGFLVIEDLPGIKETNYSGIYGIPWSLEDYDKSGKEFISMLSISSNPGTANVATNWDVVYRYWKKTLQYVNVRLLFIETPLQLPIIQKPENEGWTFEGYDLAYASGDLYSAVQQDLLVKKIPSLVKWFIKLNENRLFDTLEDVNAFAKSRQELTNGIETVGDFYIIRIYQYEEIVSP
jgi:hypothetical protein